MEFVLALFDASQQKEKISQLHGQMIAVETGYGTATVVPLYHPAVALYNASQKDTLLEDFKELKGLIRD